MMHMRVCILLLFLEKDGFHVSVLTLKKYIFKEKLGTCPSKLVYLDINPSNMKFKYLPINTSLS
jgi:hypothetical protein